MRRLIRGLLAALVVAAPLTAADKADDKDNDRAKQFKDLQADFQKARADAFKAYREAKTDKEKEAALEKYRNPGDQVAKIMKLIEANPKDDLSFDMLSWALPATQGQNAQVYGLLLDNHVKNPKLTNVCRMLASNPPEAATKLLRKALDENPNADAKGYACYGLAQMASEKADQGDKAAAAEAEKLYERVVKEFGDVMLGRRATLGDLAKGGLFVIRNLLVGMTAPNVASQDLKGKKVELKDYKGKVVVLDIWATWCGPCRAMIPHEREMVKKLKDKPFALISVSADAEIDTLKKFLDKEEMPWTHWWSGDQGGLVKEWNIQHFPTIYVIDAKGVIRYKEIRGEQLEEAVEKLLAEVKK